MTAPSLLLAVIKAVPSLSDIVLKGDKVYAISSKRVKRLKNVNPEVVKKAVSEIADSIAVKGGINPAPSKKPLSLKQTRATFLRVSLERP